MKSEGSRLLAEETLLAAEQSLIARSAATVPGLIDVLANGVSAILTAASVSAVLPEILAQMARVIPLQRLTITERLAQTSEANGMLFHWQTSLQGTLLPVDTAACASASAPRWLQALALSEQLPGWLEPLSTGGQVLVSRVHASEPLRTLLADSRTTSLLAVPIMIDGRHWGQICFEDGEGAIGWHAEELRVLAMLAEIIGAAMTRERFFAQVRAREALLRAITNAPHSS